MAATIQRSADCSIPLMIVDLGVNLRPSQHVEGSPGPARDDDAVESAIARPISPIDVDAGFFELTLDRRRRVRPAWPWRR